MMLFIGNKVKEKIKFPLGKGDLIYRGKLRC